jgi:hypothetical protein
MADFQEVSNIEATNVCSLVTTVPLIIGKSPEKIDFAFDTPTSVLVRFSKKLASSDILWVLF